MPEGTRPIAVETQGAACERPEPRNFVLRPRAVLRGIRPEDVSSDVIAGLTVAAVAIPQAIAYASIAELPAQVGLYTAAIAAVVGSLWGCSRFLATGPVNALSLLVLPILLGVAAPGTPEFLVAASLIALLAGGLSIMLSLLRFGALVTLASRSVLIGFTAGAAIHIAVGQLRHLFGLNVPAMPELHRTFTEIVKGLGQTNLASLYLGLAALVIMIGLRRLGGARVPAALIAIVATALVVWILGLDQHGVRVVGSIPRELPPLTWVANGMFPDMHMIRGVVLGAMAVAALGLIEAVAAAQTLARRSGDQLDANQEFFGQGLANIAAGLFSGYPCSGSFTRSALAHDSGARTHLTGVVTGVTVLAGMLIFAPYAHWIPRAAIAGVLLVIAWRMVDREGIRRVLRTSRSEAGVMLITFCATLVLPLDFAVMAGVVFSLAFFVIRSSLPRVVNVVPDPTFRHFVENPERPVCPQLGVLNIRGPLFFGAVHHLEEEFRRNRDEHPGQNLLVLRMHGVDICDLSGVEMLETMVKDYRQLGGDVYMVRPRRTVMKVLEQSAFLDETLGRDHILEQEGAIEYLFDKVIDPAVCIYACEHRVFAECQALEKHTYGVEFPPPPKPGHADDHLVSPERFQELAGDTDALVFDLREFGEYRQGHIPGAALLPLRMLSQKAPELPRDRTLLMACRSGRRTARAIHMLEDLGFSQLHGLRGGILAWRAEGLPVAGVEGDVESADSAAFPAAPAGTGSQRRFLSQMRLKRRTEQIDHELELFTTIRDLPVLKEKLEHLLDEVPTPEGTRGGCVTLDPSRPVLIVSDSHALRQVFHRLLLDKYVGYTTNLESIIQGDLQLVLLGDLLHSESESRWQAIREEFAAEFETAGAEVGPTPHLDEEMANALGLAAMILTLQSAAPGVHCLKGNHDNLLNTGEHGNQPLLKFISDPGEGEITRAWALVRMGASFAGKYAAWENRLPLFAVYDNADDGLKFVASHSEPGEPYTFEQVERRDDEVVLGLTWSRNLGQFAPDVLRNIFGRHGPAARYFVSHTGSEQGIVHIERNNLVIMAKPRYLVAVLIHPGTPDFEVHMVGEI